MEKPPVKIGTAYLSLCHKIFVFQFRPESVALLVLSKTIILLIRVKVVIVDSTLTDKMFDFIDSVKISN